MLGLKVRLRRMKKAFKKLKLFLKGLYHDIFDKIGDEEFKKAVEKKSQDEYYAGAE